MSRQRKRAPIPKKLAKTHWKLALDKLCRRVVFARDGNRCVKCGKRDGIQWCHVESRRYTSTRWDTRFSMTLCAGHHLHWHHRPVEAVTWWTTTYPDRAKALELARGQKHKVDPELIKLQLQLEAKRLGIEP